MLSNVVLPDPEGPVITTNSPRSTRRFTPLSTCTGPAGVAYDLPMSRNCSTGMAAQRARSWHQHLVAPL